MGGLIGITEVGNIPLQALDPCGTLYPPLRALSVSALRDMVAGGSRPPPYSLVHGLVWAQHGLFQAFVLTDSIGRFQPLFFEVPLPIPCPMPAPLRPGEPQKSREGALQEQAQTSPYRPPVTKGPSGSAEASLRTVPLWTRGPQAAWEFGTRGAEEEFEIHQ